MTDRPQRENPPGPGEPPPLEGEWLSTPQAAERLGISGARVRFVAARGRMPATWNDGRYWFRADLLEQYAAAREARRERRP